MLNQIHTFECGCSFPIIGPPIGKSKIPLLDLNLDIETIRMDCPGTWQLISKGLTKGVFQLESNLGKQYAKKLRPENIEHMAALGSLLRPGSLRALDDKGISMTDHYCLRKNKEEETVIKYPELNEILGPTYDVIAYQEQCMQIAVKVAGFTEQESDNLRKAIGKKLPEEMAKVKKMFLEKGEQAGILTKEALEEIFGWIEKSQRYSFNKSHAVGYALNGYLSAYCKYHFPLQFYTSYLASSKDTQKPTEEIRELVNDTKLMKIEVKPHDIRMKNHDFVNDGEFIYFGLRNIKGVGESGCKNVSEILSLFDVANSKWFGILIQFSRLPSLFEKLILAGCFDFLGLQRQFMLYELRCLNKLSEGELDWIYYNAHRFTSLKEALVAALKPKYRTTKKKKDLGLLLTEIKPVDLDDYGAAATVKSVNKIKSIIRSLDNPPISLEDTVDFIVQNEEELLGVAITCSRIDDKNTYIANCTCSEFIKINQKNIIIAAEIQEVKVIKIKNGQNCGRQMAFLTVSDNTGSLPDITIFSDAYDKYKNMLQINNTIMLRGKKDYKRKCLIADEIYQL